MHDSDPAKRIPKSIGTDAQLLGTYTLSDLAVATAPGVAVILLIQVVVPAGVRLHGHAVTSLGLPLAVIGTACGGLFVYLTPGYTTSVDWLETFAGFLTSSEHLPHEAAKQHTQVERVYPEHGAIERTDGALLALVRVTPPTMALATDAEWERKAAAFRDFCNTVVEFPIQIYSTTREFPVEKHVGAYEARLSDPDVEANPRLATLIERYVDWYADDLTQRRMTIRDHYVVVPVEPTATRFEPDSVTAKLAALPVVGSLLRAWSAPPRAQQRATMFKELDERVRRVEAGLRKIEGCAAERVPSEEATRVIGEYWTGTDQPDTDLARVLRSRPMVGGSR